MAGLVALCADRTSLQHPEALGLGGECLAAQDWLRVFTSAEEARRFLRSDRAVDEVWVASSDEIEPINLAATLKHDRGDRCVCLLAFEGTGSLWSRASAAGIDASLTRQAFVARYGQRKRYAAGEALSRAHIDAERQKDVESRLRAMESLGAQAVGSGAGSSAATATQETAKMEPQVERVIVREVSSSAKSAGERALEPSSSPFLFPVVSGGGGVGKSTIAVLSALLAQKRGLRTLVLDFDLQFGDMPRLLGVEDPLTMEDALASPGRLDHVAPEGEMPALLAAPKRLELSEIIAKQTPELLDALSGKFDVVVANTGASWSEQHAVLLERCSKALFLVDQRPSSLEACQRALDLCARCGIAAGPFAFALNRCAKRSLFSSIDVACTLHVQRVFELADGGRDVEELLGAGMPFELIDSRNPLCASVDAMLDELLPGADEEASRGVSSRSARGGLFGRRSSRKREGGAA